jgi:transcriptional regulator with PAS, ATPase and Fis domain
MNLPILSSTQSALESARQLGALLTQRNSYLTSFITEDPSCLAIKSTIGQLSMLTDSVLILGDSGTGKELIAHSLHWRVMSPFIAVNCAALPETLYLSTLFGHVKGAFTGALDDKLGVFESAGDGIVFLDEIGDMPLHQQAALLRIIQERTVTRIGEFEPRPISCRIIAATNKDLFKVGPNVFRDDLLGRISTFTINIPPFSARPDDVRLIAESLGLDPERSATLYALYPEFINRFGARGIQTLVKRLTLFNTV